MAPDVSFELGDKFSQRTVISIEKWTYSREKAANSIEPSVGSRKKRSNNIEERPELMLSLSNYYDPWRGRLRAQGYPSCRFRRDLA